MSAEKHAVYLDNAATSYPKPRAVISAMRKAVETSGNPGRGGHGGALAAARMVFETRMKLAEFFQLPNPERLIFTRGATEGINLALKGLLVKGDMVAVSGLEHNAVMRPLESLKKLGVRVIAAPLDKNGLPDPSRVPKVKMLISPGASNVTGAILDVKKVGAACRELGVVFMVDAAQTAGSVPFDTSLIDILVCAGHKGMMGPQGIGFAWFRKGVEPEPFIEGGTGSESERFETPSLWPDRFEAGTMNTPGIAGLGAAVGYLSKLTVKAVREREIEHCAAILEYLLNEPRIAVYGPKLASKRASLVMFNVQGVDPADVAHKLNRYGISVRAGLHCAPTAHKFIGTFPEGAVRASPGVMTSKKDVKDFIAAMRKIVKGK